MILINISFSYFKFSKRYTKTKNWPVKHGTIHDEAKKFYGIICVLDYGLRERKLKVEISNRSFDDHYEIKNLLGVNMQVS